MKRVSYITQVNLFMELGVKMQFTPCERALWFGVFINANKIAQDNKAHLWPDGYLTITTSEMKNLTGMNARAVRRNREKLRDEYHLIDYIDGDGRKRQPQYRLNYLTKINGEIVPEGVCDSDSNNVSHFVSDHVCDPHAIEAKTDPDTVTDKSYKMSGSNSSSASIEIDNVDTAIAIGVVDRVNDAPGYLHGLPGLVDLDTDIEINGLIT